MVRPRPVPSYLPRGRGVLLLEGPEDALLLVPRDADAGVAHREPEADLLRRRRKGAAIDFHADVHLSFLGELDGVAHEVEQHLPQPARVADQGVGHVRLHLVDQLQPLRVSPHGQRPQGVPDRRPQGEIAWRQFHLPGLDLGEVEQVIDEAEQVVGRGLDRPQALPLVLGQRRVEHQFGHAEDGVHGRADLMADVGQELVLGPIGRLRRLLRLPQLRVQSPAFRDVLHHRDDVGGPARRVTLEGDVQLTPDDRAAFVDITLLERVTAALTLEEGGQLLGARRQVLGVGECPANPGGHCGGRSIPRPCSRGWRRTSR